MTRLTLVTYAGQLFAALAADVLLASRQKNTYPDKTVILVLAPYNRVFTLASSTFLMLYRML